MVRFVLRNKARSVSMKMDLKEDDAVSEIGDTAEEYWGGGFILRSGYSLLRPDGRVGDYIGDGDVVDALPDPDFCRDWADPRRRSRGGSRGSWQGS